MISQNSLRVSPVFHTFIEQQALSGTGVAPARFWEGLALLSERFGERIRAALARREELQGELDAWHISRRGQPFDAAAYEAFLREIGYLEPEGPDFQIDTTGIDAEIANQPGPQLVVPISNARFALNAANARWGSLYDALYGTDALGDLPEGGGYDRARGARVIAWAKAHLDSAVPLEGASWAGVHGVRVASGALVALHDGSEVGLQDPSQLVGYRGDESAPEAVLLRRNGLHLEIVFNADHPVGSDDPAHIADVVLESAVSTIMDCEDSVAAVDAADKAQAYGNWLGLMRGDLEEEINKGGRSFTRRLASDRVYHRADGSGDVQLKGRSLMLVRNVGHLMTTPAVLDAQGRELSEGLLDALTTVAIALHDVGQNGARRNSVEGSVYVVKPKMHGPAEVALTDEIFTAVEEILGLPQYSVKIGIMDEERRTSANLKACIRAARHRVAFINTGFLDRTGDEIHTSMEAGPMVRKGEMKAAAWIASYEDRNVDIGLACGLKGRAQIGKGMWAMPDRMGEMLDAKIGHLQAGATCAWVPSPTAAVLHATHYHRLDVLARQDEIAAGGARGSLEDLLTIPVMQGQNLSEEEITREVENNAQGILGYVVRWVDQGIGCSKVPDINDVGLMEDRATCRISAQALANWLHHGLISETRLRAAFEKMAGVVDQQNASDPDYQPMAPAFNGAAFRAAWALAFEGRTQPSGYTEPLLHKHRLEAKG